MILYGGCKKLFHDVLRKHRWNNNWKPRHKSFLFSSDSLVKLLFPMTTLFSGIVSKCSLLHLSALSHTYMNFYTWSLLQEQICLKQKYWILYFLLRMCSTEVLPVPTHTSVVSTMTPLDYNTGGRTSQTCKFDPYRKELKTLRGRPLLLRKIMYTERKCFFFFFSSIRDCTWYNCFYGLVYLNSLFGLSSDRVGRCPGGSLSLRKYKNLREKIFSVR